MHFSDLVLKSDQFVSGARMPFQKIEAEKLSLAVARQIEGLILQGILCAGERLPSERDMAEMMGVSRPSLREALSALQDDGLLVVRAGSGIYVAEAPGPAFSPALARLISRHPDAVEDYLDFRKDIEGLAAERAARSASEADLAVIAAICARMEAAHHARDADAEAALDVAFHMAIVEASHNIVALHMMRAMFELLREGVLYSRTRIFCDVSGQELLRQHLAINTAIQARNGAAAKDCIAEHLDYVARSLATQRRADRQEETAHLRLRHLQQGKV